MLSRIKMGFPEIRQALLDIDDHRLSIDDLKAISKQLPTPEEVCVPLISRGYTDYNRTARLEESKVLTTLAD
jgi:hypothetical protein